MFSESKFQIGKNSLTEGAINSLKQDLKTHKQVRISVLKTATRDKKQLKKIVEEIIQKVNCKCRYKIIGFTIVLRRLSSKAKSK